MLFCVHSPFKKKYVIFFETQASLILFYFSSHSSEEENSFKLSQICPTTFFQYIYTPLERFADNSFHLFSGKKSQLITAKQV